MKSELYKCCAFTGHRPSKLPWKYDENDNRCVKLKAVLTRQIEKLAAAGVTDFYTGMALGVDTWAAMAVLDLQERNTAIKLYCVLPCEGRGTKWTPPAQARYKHILSEADSVEYVKRIYDKKCMLERNQRLVDSAAFLLAVYNGEKRGGRAATVRYAQKAGRKIIVINPITRLVSNSETTPHSSLRRCAGRSDQRERQSHAARRVRRDVKTSGPGFGGTPTSEWGYPKGYPHSLLAHSISDCHFCSGVAY